MRKRIIYEDFQDTPPADESWLDLPHLAQVELTSEDAAQPIEAAFSINAGSGWRAAQPGRQMIRLLFNEPQRIRCIHLVFEEGEQDRTQEFLLRWSADGGKSYREVVRQQYNFSPPSNTREVEDYAVDLGGVTVLELRIIPNISGGAVRASLAQLRLA